MNTNKSNYPANAGVASKLHFSNLETLLAITIKHRKDLLDFLQVAMASSPNWGPVRSKVMSVFGREGIEGQIQSLLKSKGANSRE
jgi:hypothetical protein